MTQEEKYINFMLNYNQKLKEKNTDWLNPTDLGNVLINTAEQNDPGCVHGIIEDLRKKLQ